jgi:hypothetical protein
MYHPLDPSKPLLDPVKVKACSGVEVARIKTIRAARRGLGCIALVSTTTRYRLKAFRQAMIPERYNEVDRSGLQIGGSEGLIILCNDPETLGDYNVYKSMVDGVISKNHTSFGTLLGNWTREGWEKNVEEMEELEAAALHAMPSEDSATEENTVAPPQKKAFIGETPDWARRQFEKQEQRLARQEELIQQILKAVDTGKLEQREDASSLKEAIETMKESLEDCKKDIITNQEEATASLKEDMGTMQETLQTNHIDAAFLTETLKTTMQERDGLRATVQSQAGKTGAVTKQLNKALKENAKLISERQVTVERQEVINAVMQAAEQLKQNARRAEGRIADALHIEDQPLGDQCDNFPYDQWPEPAFENFKTNLWNNYKKAPTLEKRHDLPPLKDFPDAAKSRYFHIGIALVLSTPQHAFNLDKSPAQHRRELTALSGPIYHKDVYDAVKSSFITQEKCLNRILAKSYVEDPTVDTMIQGDPFCTPEVSVFIAWSPSILTIFTTSRCCIGN